MTDMDSKRATAKCRATARRWSVSLGEYLVHVGQLLLTRNSANLTDQRGSYAFTCSSLSIPMCHVRHRLPTFNIDILVYYLFSRHKRTACVRAVNTGLLFYAPSSGNPSK